MATMQNSDIALMLDAGNEFLDTLAEHLRSFTTRERRVLLRLIACERPPIVAVAPRNDVFEFIERVSKATPVGDAIWQVIYILPVCHPLARNAMNHARR
jgi:hypothetical protein